MNIESDLTNDKQGSLNKTEQVKSSYQLVNQILQVNCFHESLKHYWQITRKKKWGWKLQDNLLTQFKKLMMSEVNTLQTHLIKKTHALRKV